MPNAKRRCPICQRPAIREFVPFCSKRCADEDLGNWLGGRYAVPAEPASLEDETLEEE